MRGIFSRGNRRVVTDTGRLSLGRGVMEGEFENVGWMYMAVIDYLAVQ